ncbi:hypothetical protein LEP1GSC083_1850 [Leptospira interrogans serovar Pyrogenes str. L0374]|uniref:Uncharacterized protein n=1 Tax=Leptospira interrogans serovar Pyrogenes str. L0374 TaxID=1049928 RepID=M6KQG8_LEPIR|nr:hypothetical protein LEP1GSC083_1850 [Leptospira interrogans serovar Pyrogenes str. L0374]
MEDQYFQISRKIFLRKSFSFTPIFINHEFERLYQKLLPKSRLDSTYYKFGLFYRPNRISTKLFVFGKRKNSTLFRYHWFYLFSKLYFLYILSHKKNPSRGRNTFKDEKTLSKGRRPNAELSFSPTFR